jgi:hypothetical protein
MTTKTIAARIRYTVRFDTRSSSSRRGQFDVHGTDLTPRPEAAHVLRACE